MKLPVDRREALEATADVVVSGVFERGEKDDGLPRVLAREAEAVGPGLLSAAWARQELRGKRREVTVFHRPDGHGRLLLVGLGPVARFSAETVRRAAAEAVKALKGKGARTVAFRLPSFTGHGVGAAVAARALVDGAVLGAYEFVTYRATSEGRVEEAAIHLGPSLGRDAAAVRAAVAQELALAEVVVWTRDLANLPANTATPERLAEEARALAKEFGLRVTVFDEKQLAQMGCGGLLAVGSGSVHPPRLIVLEYAGRTRRPRTVAVVGKGITFDSGGISIKPGPRMSEMKFDKSGAVATLGILRAAATLRVAPRVVGVLCCAENLPSGSAYRPGDVVRTYGGKTIEVLNTDAEGRVVLSDGLGYVVKNYQPDEVIDLATLTSAVVVALGDDTAALVATDDRLARGLLAASQVTGEPFWRMPLTDHHREMVKSEIADVRNSTEMQVSGALTASAFLETFVGDVPWAHLDIAGPAYTTLLTRKYQPAYQTIGATGFGVRTVAQYLLTAPARG